MRLRTIQDTFFKQSAVDSSKVSAQDKVKVKAGQVFEIHSWKPIGRNHLKIAIVDQFLGNPPRNTWYVYQPDIWLLNSKGQIIPPPSERSRFRLPDFGFIPKTKRLNIPHKSQLDNYLNPRGACNVTSYAMIMEYLKIPRQGQSGQLEDELYSYMLNNGLSRWDPYDLATMGRDYGLAVDIDSRATLSELRKAIAEGYGCIIHGYFTSFGHIIVVKGYDQNGFYVNDPYGEWYESGYRNDRSGENLYYSNQLIQAKCSPEGKDYLWLHKITRSANL
jgi:Peptidase_C39 like family